MAFMDAARGCVVVVNEWYLAEGHRMNAFRLFATACVGVVTVTLFPALASAVPITFTEQVTASGFLGATPFTGALVTLTAVADTAGVVNAEPGIFRVQNLTTTVDVTTVGSATFTGSVITFVNQSVGVGGIEDGTVVAPDSDILDVVNSSFATYNLMTAIGPLSGAGSFNAGTPFATTSGNFRINSISSNATFTATLSPAAVPEPCSLVLSTLGVALAAWRRRKGASRRRTSAGC